MEYLLNTFGKKMRMPSSSKIWCSPSKTISPSSAKVQSTILSPISKHETKEVDKSKQIIYGVNRIPRLLENTCGKINLETYIHDSVFNRSCSVFSDNLRSTVGAIKVLTGLVFTNGKSSKSSFILSFLLG